MNTVALLAEAPATDPAIEQIHTPPSFFEERTLGDYCRLAYYSGMVAIGAMFDTTDKVLASYRRYINEPGVPPVTASEDADQADSHIWVDELWGDDGIVNDLGRLGYYIEITILNMAETAGMNIWGWLRKAGPPSPLKVTRGINGAINRLRDLPRNMSSLKSEQILGDPTLAEPQHSAAMDIGVNIHGPY